MHTTNLERQTTSKYHAGYSHLEETEPVGLATVLEMGELPTSDEDSTVLRYLLGVVAECTDEEIRQGIRAEFSRSCQCEHDCCGHWVGGVDDIKSIGQLDDEGERWFSVVVSYGRNV